jgi:hypothetical protein
MNDAKVKRVARKSKPWLRDQIVEDVTDSLALCEFGCRKQQCRMGEWDRCERRLQDVQDLPSWKAPPIPRRLLESTLFRPR